MGAAISDMLPFAVAIAVSPIPILAVVFMLMSDGGRRNAIAFLAGWAAMLVVVASGVALLGIGGDGNGSGRGVAIAQLVLAALLVVVIAVEWRGRARPGPPRWMEIATGAGPRTAFGLGVALIVLNAKDGSLAVAAGAKLGEAGLGVVATAACVLVFTLVASATVIGPLAVDLVLGERATPILRRWHAWLERHGRTAVVVTLAVVVVVLIVQGIGGL